MSLAYLGGGVRRLPIILWNTTVSFQRSEWLPLSEDERPRKAHPPDIQELPYRRKFREFIFPFLYLVLF